ncbi:hypothetical protein HPP92_024612 [Vanilla planifolia]|uniref:Uncharacterized protein n=1 Tax=Vanilla planifolia TaxID=51239 RepID=A0A835PSE9_VANPL|nr:hypothetical protein HPP92_024612 [Vanilla planifolia]
MPFHVSIAAPHAPIPCNSVGLSRTLKMTPPPPLLSHLSFLNLAPVSGAMHEPVGLTKTHEILARFRPIAPKTQLPSSVVPTPPTLRPRPCRPRKRGRAAVHPTNRPNPPPTAFPDRRNLSPSLHPPLVERDLLRKLQEPDTKLVAPRPVRPVGSTISVGPLVELQPPPPPTTKRAKEVEDELESDPFPAVVTGRNNKVKFTNSRYKELVGQPECMWLDSMNSYIGGFGFDLGLGQTASRRINGEVVMDFSGCDVGILRDSSSVAFSCKVKIEWKCDGRKSFLDVPCDVARVYCDSKDYLFTWRFHTADPYRTRCMS